MPAAAVPALITAGGSIGASLLGRRSAKNAAKQSPAELQAQQQQQDVSRELVGQGRTLTNYGMPQLQQASRYYSTLAGGNRAALSQTMAPDVQHINATYGGTQRTLSRFLKGPDRDFQLGELARQRAGAIGGLFTGARDRGVAGLTSLGQYGVSQGSELTRGAAGVAGNVQAAAGNARLAGEDIQSRAGADMGRLVFEILQGLNFGTGSKASAGRVPSMPGPSPLNLGSIGTTSPVSLPRFPTTGANFPQNPRIYGGVRF